MGIFGKKYTPRHSKNYKPKHSKGVARSRGAKNAANWGDPKGLGGILGNSPRKRFGSAARPFGMPLSPRSHERKGLTGLWR